MTGVDIGIDVTALVKNAVGNIDMQLRSRAFRAAQELRKAEVQVLRGQRTGKRYKAPASGRVNKKTGQISFKQYASSAPGEPPAVRTGTLRSSWRVVVKDKIQPGIESNVKYAGYLEHGTSKMAARPYEKKIIDKAMPAIEAIYQEPYT